MVGEVLLTRECRDENDDDDDVELLEGLTSNLFVVYHNGTLQTPPCDSVLGGYARQLVLDCAAASGTRWEVMEGSIKLSEASQWKEVFTTSAIRLVSPVNVVIQVQPGDGTTKTVWTQSERNDDESSWKQVYLKILDTVTIGSYGDEERKSHRFEDA
jgi:branched-subunit amino acid aminotransferase/4-amino-4-deoxychorismate lyase